MSGKALHILLRTLDRLASRFGGNPRATAGHLNTGTTGEDTAYFYLRDHGYVIVARNWRVAGAKGEVDLIGWDSDVLCFIEVKTRTSREVKPAEAAVDEHKRRALRSMSRRYCRRARIDGPIRFDVVSVYLGSEGAVQEVTLFRNAFPVS